MKTAFVILLYGLNARQVPQVSNQVAQVSNQVAQVSYQGQQEPQVSYQVAQVSNQTPQVSYQGKLEPQVSYQAEQVSNQVEQKSNQVAQVSNQQAQVSYQGQQEQQVSYQAAQVSNQVPQVSNQTAQVSNQEPNQHGDPTDQPATTMAPSLSCENGLCFMELFDGGFATNNLATGRENELYPDVVEFSGIKFADSERFMAPVAINDYANTDFSKPGYSCATVNAVNTGSETLPVSTEQVEDCLYIRIWVKKSALVSGAARRKVMSWIHGGTFNFGGVDVIYESPAKLVDEQDIIVAKMNYRLGPFGNWYMPLRIDGQPKSSFGVQDQRAGLKWIKDHIGKFNGDDGDEW